MPLSWTTALATLLLWGYALLNAGAALRLARGRSAPRGSRRLLFGFVALVLAGALLCTLALRADDGATRASGAILGLLYFVGGQRLGDVVRRAVTVPADEAGGGDDRPDDPVGPGPAGADGVFTLAALAAAGAVAAPRGRRAP